MDFGFSSAKIVWLQLLCQQGATAPGPLMFSFFLQLLQRCSSHYMWWVLCIFKVFKLSYKDCCPGLILLWRVLGSEGFKALSSPVWKLIGTGKAKGLARGEPTSLGEWG